jgi:hypothetical protein
MQLREGLKSIFKKIRLDDIIEDNVKEGFEKFKNKIEEIPKYLDERLEYVRDKTYYVTRKVSEYRPIIASAAFSLLPPYAKALILAGSYIENSYKGHGGKLLKYVLTAAGIGMPVGIGIMILLHPINSLPSNNEHIQYVGSGYEAFVPNGQTINYDGHTDPVGELILNNGTIIHNVIWDGKYANTIIQTDNQIFSLNNQFVGQTDPVNNQPYVRLWPLYIIKGPVPIENTTIDGQTYYVIEANNINLADIGGFYTYQGWVTNFVAAMNTPGTYPAGLSGNSPVFTWKNIIGTVAFQTEVYGRYGPFPGRYVLVLPNNTIIPYGVNNDVVGEALINFYVTNRTYNPSS